MINSQLKHSRKFADLTQAELAYRSKVSVRYYQELEAGRCSPGVEIAKRIAKALNAKVEDIFPDDHADSPNEE